jgi:hypothetical protein
MADDFLRSPSEHVEEGIRARQRTKYVTPSLSAHERLRQVTDASMSVLAAMDLRGKRHRAEMRRREQMRMS